MSNALAIAAVTATLRNLLQSINQVTGLEDTTVSTKPPDQSRNHNDANQLNLFLYQVLPNAAWRNMDNPQYVKSGETSMPPLPLNLYYMLTAYGRGHDDVFGHRLLGEAMSILYDHPLLGPQEIQAALPSDSNSGLQNQVERVRITLQPLSVEEIFRLWSGFQTQYRVSVSYEVAVVLIDSKMPGRTPLPVLTRGREDRGVTSQAGLTPPFPTIGELLLPHPPSALLNDDLTLKGHDLLPGPDPALPPAEQIDNSQTKVRFTNPRWPVPVELGVKLGSTPTANVLTVALSDVSNSATTWPAGFYTVAVVYRNSSGRVMRTSNELSFSLAPQILTPPHGPGISATHSGNKMTITLRCRPAIQRTVQQMEPGGPQTVQQEQRVNLLVGDREVPVVFPDPSPPPPVEDLTPLQDLTFEIKDLDVRPLPVGDYFVRLRVDGVDSLLVNRAVQPPQFDQSQKVTIPS